MAPRDGISKWQKKSVALNQVRWELEKILTEDLSPEEKESLKYRELISAVYSAVEHSVPIEFAKEGLEQRLTRRRPWLTTMWYSLAAGAGGIVAALAPTLLNWLALLWKYCFGGA